MIVAVDLTWMKDSNLSGGAFHYALRLTQALVKCSNESIVAIVNTDLSDLFFDLHEYDNFKLVRLSSAEEFKHVIKEQHVEVIHRPLQEFDYVTLSVPMINSLHDLQQFHYPEFFDDNALAYREMYYRGSAEFSERVIVSYQHVKDDVIKFYGIAAEKIDVCPVGMVEPEMVDNSLYPEVKHRYGLPDRYLFYSAGTWRHKNHIGLIKALKVLRDRHGIIATLICTGYQYPDYFPEIERAIAEMQLENSVRFLGYVPDADMPLLLTNAALVVIPTLYEAGSYPLLEAMAYGVPVICSNVTSLPDSIGDSRFVFDPSDPEQMANLIATMLISPQLVEENKKNSLKRAQSGGWNSAVQEFIRSYKRAKLSFQNKKSRVYLDKCIASYEDEISQLQHRLTENNVSSQVSAKNNSLVSKIKASFEKIVLH